MVLRDWLLIVWPCLTLPRITLHHVVSASVVDPKPTFPVSAKYPEEARIAELEGLSVIKASIDADGQLVRSLS
jgi:hypothetical protein